MLSGQLQQLAGDNPTNKTRKWEGLAQALCVFQRAPILCSLFLFMDLTRKMKFDIRVVLPFRV